MKLFDILIGKSEKKQKLTAVETWIVRWESLERDSLGWGIPKIKAQAFVEKSDAEAFRDKLNDARKLLGDKRYPANITRHNPS